MPRRSLEELRQIGIDDSDVEQVPYSPIETQPREERDRLEAQICALEEQEARASSESR